ncbi:MAG TPA: septal ring lytic transglycosylase RlpA family protein [Caldimonas sp.]|nr:septal ring lytic transglycosylase RlpA family protein [Caldimonas sp.]
MRFSLVATLPRPLRPVLAATLVAILCGCASGPRAPQRAPVDGGGDRDGPGANPPTDLAGRADAEPRVEAVRVGGANKPYQVQGKTYVPETRDVPFRERGLASWYGRKFHGKMTSSGEPYDMYAMTAAHPTLPIPSYARIRNPANGREVIVRINDRGPFVSGRIVDLSYTAALKLDLLRGVGPVELERITFDDIRTGAWRGNRAPRSDVDPSVQLAAAPSTAATPAAPAPVVAAAATVVLQPTSPATAATVPTQDVALVAASPAAVDAGRFWVQLGAFRARDGAETFRSQLGSDAVARWLEPLLVIVGESAPYRVQAGPYRSRDEADEAAQRARSALAIVPVVVERR